MILNAELKHLAIIMDGNGRWAQKNNLTRSEGHNKGYSVFLTMIKHIATFNIPELTFFTLSGENLTRPESEVTHFMHLFVNAVKYDLALLIKHNIKVKVIGDITRLNVSVRAAIDVLHAASANGEMQLNICFAYGGQWHIESAFEECRKNNGDLAQFRQLLMSPFLRPIDFVIRTGGDVRISNFALWQLAYSEMMFVPEYWPEFNISHLQECLLEFNKRTRRFGQIS